LKNLMGLGVIILIILSLYSCTTTKTFYISDPSCKYIVDQMEIRMMQKDRRILDLMKEVKELDMKLRDCEGKLIR